MSRGVTVDSKQVRKQIRKMQDAVSKTAAKSEMKALHLEGAELVKSDALGRVPVATGQLRGSVRAAGTVSYGAVRAGFAKVPYAGPIHFGWSKRNIRPQPFLYDAKDARADEVVEVFDKRMKSLIKKFDLD
jgi:HK97 gp10 family phage protein